MDINFPLFPFSIRVPYNLSSELDYFNVKL